MRKDDIVVILSDQHANWALPDKIDFLDAPIFSEMINNGEYFENCVCNSPLCVPSRMSFRFLKSALFHSAVPVQKLPGK